MRSSSHLDHILAGTGRFISHDRLQNVIQAVSPNPYFPEDLACAAAQSSDGASAAELHCSKNDLTSDTEAIGAERDKKK
jgi:hypothetical protein